MRVKAATIEPPRAGPTCAREIVAGGVEGYGVGDNSRGTSSGMMACQAGLFMAEPMLSRR